MWCFRKNRYLWLWLLRVWFIWYKHVSLIGIYILFTKIMIKTASYRLAINFKVNIIVAENHHGISKWMKYNIFLIKGTSWLMKYNSFWSFFLSTVQSITTTNSRYKHQRQKLRLSSIFWNNVVLWFLHYYDKRTMLFA